MNRVCNFFLSSRLNAGSPLEKTADRLMTPLRLLLGGRQVAVFFDGTMYVAKQKLGRLNTPPPSPCGKLILKVIAFVMLPFAAIGALIKLVCLKDAGYRAFCAKKIPASSTCTPKFSEIFQHLHYTNAFAAEAPTPGTVEFAPLSLSECSCAETGEFHRLRSPRRDNLENAIAQRLIETISDKKQLLPLLSMGSGGLMSDFFILEKLVLAGFKHILIDCVDPKIDLVRIEKIGEFFADSGATVRIRGYSNIDAVDANKHYSALLAVDYDPLSALDFKATGDLMKAFRKLNADGFMGLGFSDEDTLYGPNTPLTFVRSRSSALFNLAGDLTQQLPQKDKLTIVLPSLHFANASNVFLLALAMAAEKAGKKYQTISISSMTFPADISHFKQMMESLFPQTTIDISSCQPKKYDCDVCFTGVHESTFRSKGYLAFLQPQALTYILSLKSLQRQIGTREDQRVQIRGFSVAQ